MSRKKIIIAAVIVVILAAAVAANIYFRREQGITVTTEAIRARDLEALVSASGRVQPKRRVNISANRPGRVTRLAVEEGQPVKAGQFLLEIDPRSLEGMLQRGEAGVAAAEAGLQQARVGVLQAEANLEQSRAGLALAEQNLQRQQDLWKDGLTTREALERAQNEVTIREAELKAQQQAVRSRQVEIQSREQQIRQEQASLATTKYDLNQVIISSPMDGIVTRRNIEEGETAITGTMNNPGTVLLEIADMSVLEAEVEVDETDIPSVTLGQAATISIDAVPDRTFKGRVTEIGNSPIQTAQNTGQRQATTFRVVVTIDEKVPDVRPGFTCTAEITTATRHNVTSVPIQSLTVREMLFDPQGKMVREDNSRRRRGTGSAIETPVSASNEPPPGHTRKETEGVFLLRDGKSVFTPVKTGIAGERYFEVLEGLQAGDMVITGPFASVRELGDGDAVKVEAQQNGSRDRTSSSGDGASSDRK
jgi:HlyD family secretion protein